MLEQYGKDKGERVFYASENAGTIKGVAKKRKLPKRGSGLLSPLGQRTLAGFETKYGDKGHAKFESAIESGVLSRERMMKSPGMRQAEGKFQARGRASG